METIASKYEVLSDLGSGGNSRVYKCRQLTMERIVAVKILQRTLSPGDLKRFQNEAQILSSINHPNLVRIFEFGLTKENKPYIAMEQLDGITLEQRLAQNGILLPAEFLEIFDQLLQALDCLHAQGIVHRDLKPSNVMLTFKEGSAHATLFDLGLAKRLGDEQRLTPTGDLLGTPLYMSPEQCMGNKIDVRSDLYSLGCMMYESAMGKPLFEGSAAEIMLAHSQSKRPEVPKPIAKLLAKLLAISPAERFGSADEVLAFLRSLDLASLAIFENSSKAPVLGAVSGRMLLYFSVITFVICAAGIGAFFATQNRKTEFTQEKLRSQYVDPAIEVHAMLTNKQIQGFPEVINALKTKSESWWVSKGIVFTRDLNGIGAVALQQKKRDICESAFATAILSVKKRHSNDNELIGVLFHQLQVYATEKIYDDVALKRAKELLLLSNQIQDLYWKKRVYSCIAELYLHRDELVLSKESYEKAFQFPVHPRTTDEKIEDLNFAITYCGVLNSLNQTPDTRRLVLSDRVQVLQDLMQENHPAIQWPTVNAFAIMANHLPVSSRPKSFVKALVQLMQTAEARYSSDLGTVNLIRIYRGNYECQFDKAQARRTLLKVVKIAREREQFTSFRHAAYALRDNDLISPQQRLALLVEAHNNIKREPHLLPETCFMLCYHPAKTLSDLGRFTQALDYYREALGYVKQHKVGFQPKEDVGIAHALAEMTVFACEQNNFDLARDCLTEFDRMNLQKNAQTEYCISRAASCRKKLRND